MSYVRIDYNKFMYSYLPNDVKCFNGEMRSQVLLKDCWKCIRMRRIEKLPPNKEAYVLYRKEGKYEY